MCCSRKNDENDSLPKRDTALDYEEFPPHENEKDNFNNSWRDYLKTHLRRIFLLNICKISLLPHEKRKLIDEGVDGDPLATLSALYISWRSSLLCTGSIFFTINVAIEAYMLAEYGGKKWEFVKNNAADRYIGFFDKLFLAQDVLSIGLLAGTSAAVVLAWLATYFWQHCNRSQRLVRFSFALSFLPPFLLYLLLPFRHCIDFKGIQKQLCQDLLHGTAQYTQTSEDTASSLPWPGKVGGLANQLREVYSLHVPPDFCEADPDHWGNSLAGLLESNGFKLNSVTQSCPKAEDSLQLLLSAASDPVMQSAVQNVATEIDRQTISAVSFAVNQSLGLANLSADVASEINATLANSIQTAVLSSNLTSLLPREISIVVQDALRQANVSENVSSIIVANTTTNVQTALLDQMSFGCAAPSSSRIETIVASALQSVVASGSVNAPNPSSISSSGCPSACNNCTTTCLPYLHRLSSLSFVFSLEALQNTTSMGVAGHCTHCLSNQQGTHCATNCPEVVLAMSREAISGKQNDLSQLCITEDQLSQFAVLVRVGTETAYWRLLVGALFAIESMSAIMPLLLSLLLGASKGASIAKSVMPCSRVPDVVSSSAAVFTFPFLFQFGVIFQTVVGNHWTLLAIILFLTGMFLKMNPRKMKAISFKEIWAISLKLTTAKIKEWLLLGSNAEAIYPKLAKLCLLISCVFFAIALFTSEFMMSMRDNLEELGIQFTDEEIQDMKDRALWNLFLGILNVIGKSLIATVFFGDSVCDLMYYFHSGESRDPTQLQFDRAILVDDLGTMNEDQRKARRSSKVLPTEVRKNRMEAKMKADAFVNKFILAAKDKFKEDKVSILISEIKDKNQFFHELKKLAADVFENTHESLDPTWFDSHRASVDGDEKNCREGVQAFPY